MAVLSRPTFLPDPRTPEDWRPYHLKARAGSALMLTLWCVAVLSVLIVATVRLVDANVDEESRMARWFEARQLALTGIGYGSNPSVPRSEPLLHQKFPDGGELNVAIIGEGARFNINRIAKPFGKLQFRKLLELWEVPERESGAIVDSLIDWIDADDLRSLNGAEREDLEGQSLYSLPKNRNFHSVAEMERVRGMDVVAESNPDWAEVFTVFGDGKLDVQDAAVDLMMAMGGLSRSQANRIVELRNGSDKEPNTTDDLLFDDLGALGGAIGLSQTQRDSFQQNFQAGGEPTRIVSAATVGGMTCRITAVLDRQTAGGDPQFLLWEEK